MHPTILALVMGKLVWFGLVSFFNGISTFECYLVLNVIY